MDCDVVPCRLSHFACAYSNILLTVCCTRLYCNMSKLDGIA